MNRNNSLLALITVTGVACAAITGNLAFCNTAWCLLLWEGT